MMTLAPGITFDEAKHEYWYKGKQLSGITGLVAKKLGIKYSSEFVGEHAEDGIHIHKAVQKWIDTGDAGSIHPGVTWIIEELGKRFNRSALAAEVLVSDFKKYASAVDIMSNTIKGLELFDIKSGKFNREYVTWQLSIYKYFVDLAEADKPTYIHSCVCISLKDKEFYPIFPKSREAVEKLLYS